MVEAPIARAFDERTLEAMCDVLSIKCLGLTGAELSRFYRLRGIADVAAGPPKPTRMFEALRLHQVKEGSGAVVVELIRHAFTPARLIGSRHEVAQARLMLNAILAVEGLEVLPTGQVRDRAKSARPARVAGVAAVPYAAGSAFDPTVRPTRAAALDTDSRGALVAEATCALARRLARPARPGHGESRPADQAPLDLRRAPRAALRVLATFTSARDQVRLVRVLRYLLGLCAQHVGRRDVSWAMSPPQVTDVLTVIALMERRLGATQPISRAAGRS